MPQPTRGDLHVNIPLSRISVAYMQLATDFVADKIFPNIPVISQSDRYYVYDRGFFNRDEMEERAPGTPSAGSGYEVDNTPNYFAPVFAFHHDIPDQVRNNADSVINTDRDATNLVMHKALIKREKLWVTKYFTDTIWDTDIDGVAAAPGAGETLFWDDNNSDPIADVREGVTAVKESTGFKPNTMVMNLRVFNALIDHPEIIDRVKYGQTAPGVAMVDTSELSALFKVPRIFIMESIENTAKEGQTNVHTFIAGKNALLTYSTPNPGLMVPTAGYTFSWTGHLGAQSAGQRIKRFRMEPEASDRVEIEMAFDQKLVAADLGYFFNGIIS